MTLEFSLHKAMSDLDVNPEAKQDILDKLDLIRSVDTSTYEHSIRVGLLSVRIAPYLNLNKKEALVAGTLHDIGKAYIDPRVLTKKDFSDQDMQEMKKHTTLGYHILKQDHPLAAQVALRHHMFQENAYPIECPQVAGNSSDLVDKYALAVSIADFFDAITSRVNNKYGELRSFSADEALPIMIKQKPACHSLLNALYNDSVLGNQASC